MRSEGGVPVNGEIPVCSACGAQTDAQTAALDSGRPVARCCAGCGSHVCDDCLRAAPGGEPLCPACLENWRLYNAGF